MTDAPRTRCTSQVWFRQYQPSFELVLPHSRIQSISTRYSHLHHSARTPPLPKQVISHINREPPIPTHHNLSPRVPHPPSSLYPAVPTQPSARHPHKPSSHILTPIEPTPNPVQPNPTINHPTTSTDTPTSNPILHRHHNGRRPLSRA